MPAEQVAIVLVRKSDELKSGQWWLWECEYTDKDGMDKVGWIESDGHNHAIETLEDEDGNSVKLDFVYTKTRHE